MGRVGKGLFHNCLLSVYPFPFLYILRYRPGLLQEGNGTVLCTQARHMWKTPRPAILLVFTAQDTHMGLPTPLARLTEAQGSPAVLLLGMTVLAAVSSPGSPRMP